MKEYFLLVALTFLATPVFLAASGTVWRWLEWSDGGEIRASTIIVWLVFTFFWPLAVKVFPRNG